MATAMGTGDLSHVTASQCHISVSQNLASRALRVTTIKSLPIACSGKGHKARARSCTAFFALHYAATGVSHLSTGW